MRGFSLLEVMLVTILLTIISVMGWPAFQQYIWQQQLYRSAEHVYAAVQEARLKAITIGEDQWFGFSENGTLCFWQEVEQPQTCASPDSSQPKELVLQQPRERINIATNFTPIPAVRFSAFNGMAGFSAGSFQLDHTQLPEQSVRIIISTLGRVRVCVVGIDHHRFPKC